MTKRNKQDKPANDHSGKLGKLQKTLIERFGEEDTGLRDLTVTVRQDDKEPSTIYITAHRMYEYVPLNFEIMKMISEIVLTENIDEMSRHSRPGCDTCDFGSRYEWTLVCKECKL